jgi:hypothetical protein
VVPLIIYAFGVQDVSVLALINLFQLDKLRPVYRINGQLAAEEGFTEGDIVLRYYVVAFSPYGGISLNIKADYQVPIFPLAHIVALISLMLQLEGRVMISEPGNFNDLFHSFLGKTRACTGFAWIHDQIAMP